MEAVQQKNDWAVLGNCYFIRIILGCFTKIIIFDHYSSYANGCLRRIVTPWCYAVRRTATLFVFQSNIILGLSYCSDDHQY